MTDAGPSAGLPAEADIARAVQAGDVERVRQLVAESERRGAAPSAPLLQAAAQLYMKRRMWSDAAQMLGRVRGDDLGVQLQLRFARNMAALQEHRPDVHRLLVATPASSAYRIAASRTRQLTVALDDGKGNLTSLSAGDDPLGSVAQVVDQLTETEQVGQTIGLYGIGDGYLLKHLAQHPPKLFLDGQQVVYLVEPEPLAVIPCLMIHDYTGPDGPIAQPRFQWFIGPTCTKDLESRVAEDPYLPLPVTTISQCPRAVEVNAEVMGVIQRVLAAQEQDQERARAYYAQLSDEELGAVFGPNPPRQPRIMLITTRFSTVLQYATRDAAEAFEALRCQVRLIIEPSPYHRMQRPMLTRTLAEFRPDLVFQIDHLRHEHDGLFPPQLPFLCWIQDHLPNLTNAQAAAKIGPRDFVLCAMAGMYMRRYGYPQRQCLYTYKLTRVPQLPSAWDSDGDDLAYVSNASQTPQRLTERVLGMFKDAPMLQNLVRACCQRILNLYQQGQSLALHREIRPVVEQVEREVGLTITDAGLRQQVVDALFDYLNSPLYRQQGLGWAAAVAERMGLSLAVYGSGWEQHPRFARFARGPIEYGHALEQMTRRTRINLRLEPFFCISHQRLLDGLVAGGFFLSRSHLSDTANQELANFIVAHLTPSVRSVEAARAALASEHRAEFERVLEPAKYMEEFGDPVELVGGIIQAGMLLPGKRTLPHIDEISFRDERTLQERIERFVGDADLRRGIADTQRRVVEERSSYGAALRRLLDQVGSLIAAEGQISKERAA